MAKCYETLAYVDLDTLAPPRSADGDAHSADVPVVDARRSCRGKTLLLWSATGFEVVSVPTLLH